MGEGKCKGKGKAGGGQCKAKCKGKFGQKTFAAAWNKQAVPTAAPWQQLRDAAWQPPTPGTKVLTGAAAGATTENWTSCTLSSGFAMCFRQVPARPIVECINAFATLAPEDPDVLDPGENSETDVPDPRINLTAAVSSPLKCGGPTTRPCRHTAATSSEASVE